MTHGTRYGYTLAKCRCDECRAWARQHEREKYRRRVARQKAAASEAARLDSPSDVTHTGPMTTSPIDDAAAALAAASIADLMRTAYALTHRMHVATGTAHADLRAQRDLIDAEIERRTAPAVVGRPLAVVQAPVEDWCDECGCPRVVLEQHPETVGDGAEARRVIVAEFSCGHAVEYARRETGL